MLIIFYSIAYLLGFFCSFSKKLIVLLLIEGFYIYSIFWSLCHFSFGCFSFFFLMIMVMSVLDSVLGISFLISTSRDSGSYFWNSFNF